MMIVDRRNGSISDSMFANLPDRLQSGDVLVINDTRVMKARLFGVLERATGTKRDVEILFTNPLSESAWEVLCKPGKKVRRGDRILFGEDAIGTFGETRELG